MVTEVVTATIVRPNNTDVYASGDVFDTSPGAGLTFENVVRKPGDKGFITGASIILSAYQTTSPTVELWLFKQVLAAYDADNAAFTPTDADLASLVAILTFPYVYVGDATVGAGGNQVLASLDRAIPFETAENSRNLYGVYVIRNAYTPIALCSWSTNLRILQD